MLRSLSLKNLLRFWAVMTVLVVVLLPMSVIYFHESDPELVHEVMDNDLWLVIIITALFAALIFSFAMRISHHLSDSLNRVRDGLHDLSCQQFDTRLEDNGTNEDFSLIVKDFNQFASVTQNLITDLDQAKHSLQSREAYLRAVLNGVTEAIITLHNDGEIESVNPSAEALFNATNEELVGQNITRFFIDDENIIHVNDIIERQDISREFKGQDFNHQPFIMWLKVSPISSSEGDRLVCVITDITEWKQAEQQLITTSSELDTILENAMVGIAFIKDRALLRVNQKFEDIFGFNKDEVIGQNTHCLFPSVESFEELGVKAYNELEQGLVFQGEMQLSKKNGEIFWCAISSKAISASRPQDGTIWLFEDVTKQRENDEKLRKLASLDSLTGLPNRAVFNDRLAQAIRKAHRNNGRLAIFFLDLDHFKHINDSLGHNAGDELLCSVADRLRKCVREGDTVARLGGDEFTVILEDIGSVSFVAKVAEKVLNAVVETYNISGTEVNVSPSVGVSLYPADGRDADVLIRNADAAMYHAKNNGRNNFQFYSAEMNAQAAHRLSLETDLRKAVEQNDFYLNFQPQVSLESKQILGAEVLLRWNSKRWGDVSPAEFVPILEDTGLIGVVGEMVLKEACQAYMQLRDKLDPDFKMAVNLSGRQFHGSPLAAYVKRVLDDTGMAAENLELEITESILMKDTNLAVTTLSQLTELGVTLAIDDFGTGYSSLSYLKKFPLDVLKIDKSFVNDVTVDQDDAAIVDAILAMSKHLQMDVVAEGVETEEQLEFLKRHNCRRGQGYYFSRPLDFENFSELVNEQQRA